MQSEGAARTGWQAVLLPPLTVILTMAVTVLPWRVPDFAAFGLPFLTLGAVFFWAERSPGRLPSPLVLVAGLATDLVTDGPLGYWALLFLIGLALGGVAGRLAGHDRPLSQSWLGFAVTLPGIVVLGWAIASLYYLTVLDMRLMLFATAAGIGGYLPLALVLSALDRGPARRSWFGLMEEP